MKGRRIWRLGLSIFDTSQHVPPTPLGYSGRLCMEEKVMERVVFAGGSVLGE